MVSPELATAKDGPPLVVATLQTRLARTTRSHRHARGQLLGAMRGLLSVDAGASRWVVPATHAVWVPPGIAHGLRSHGPFAGWSIYVAPSICRDLFSAPCMLTVSALLREAMTRAATLTEDPDGGRHARLAAVMLDEIRAAPQAELGLPMPEDARLLKIARALSDQPDDGRHMQEWAKWAGISPRSLTRRFVVETGFSFTEWRQRVRLLRALELLAAGRPVTAIALDLGYGNVSAFIAMFRRTFGVTPGRYEEMMNRYEGSIA